MSELSSSTLRDTDAILLTDSPRRMSNQERAKLEKKV
jgi:hypothetical protein